MAELVGQRASPRFPRRLRAAADAFAAPGFERELATYLRTRPDLVEQWDRYSADQRWTPAAYVEGLETGWYDGERRDAVRHDDQAGAVADFIRRTAEYLATRP